MNLAVQRGFSLPAASRLLSVLAGKVLPGDSRMLVVFWLKTCDYRCWACREEKTRWRGGRDCSPVVPSAGMGWALGLGDSFEASCECRICLLRWKLPGCRMYRYSDAQPRFGLGWSSSPPASAWVYGCPQPVCEAGAQSWWCPLCPFAGFLLLNHVCTCGKPRAGSVLRGVRLCDGNGLSAPLAAGSRLKSRRSLEADQHPLPRGCPGQGCGVLWGAMGPPGRRGIP